MKTKKATGNIKEKRRKTHTVAGAKSLQGLAVDIPEGFVRFLEVVIGGPWISIGFTYTNMHNVIKNK